ncbi:MAG: DEAD/DEAH box helicase [Anaerolineaceae bacterium]
MNIGALLDLWKQYPDFLANITCWNIQLAAPPKFTPLSTNLNGQLLSNLTSQGIHQLYSHQAEAIAYIQDGSNVVIATGTASGKTLCYNLPILDGLLKDPNAKALYLFPTKALAQDQLKSLQQLTLTATGDHRPFSAIYDGDTPTHQRAEIRKRASIVITNPDMLHQGILPHHTLWRQFFEGLKYVVLDEMHTYRGVFGSHVANLLRRLKRIAAFYHAYPQFILTSATIGNPVELATNLIENPVKLVNQDGSPHGNRHFLVYNPPLVDERLGLRQSSLQTGIQFARKLLLDGHQTLLFARTRRSVEMILTYFLDVMPPNWRPKIRGYRSGYLKSERREIESGFKNGSIQAVVATSALELGIDIGDLESVILIGYPGSIATTHQRSGRAGRKQQSSLAIMVASPDAMDQYLALHPEYLTEQSPENALIDANNYSILLQHLQCAAFELPFDRDDHFGNLPGEVLKAFLDVMAQSGDVHLQANRYYWVADRFASGSVSLRSTTPNVITLRTEIEGTSQVVGEIDAASAAWLVHPEAIYLHEAETFEVKSLDLENGKCLLKPVQSEYYTIPSRSTTIETFQIKSQDSFANYRKSFGELSLRWEISGYRKVRWLTAETIGIGEVNLPPSFLETVGCWLSFEEDLIEKLRQEDLWTADGNNYGSGWAALKQKILSRDGYQCRVCGATGDDTQLHVHHIQPFKTFVNPDLANSPSNLITLCPSCHRQAEQNVRLRSGLAGASNALGNLAPLMVMCDREDLGILSEPRSILSDGSPTILVYDNIPGGLGLSERLFEQHRFWLDRTREMISDCQCLDGCPACVGPIGEAGHGGKAEALALLEGLY